VLDRIGLEGEGVRAPRTVRQRLLQGVGGEPRGGSSPPSRRGMCVCRAPRSNRIRQPDHDCGRAGGPHAIFCSPLDPTATLPPRDTGALRYSRIKGIATAPSPTAEPTRLAEPERTSRREDPWHARLEPGGGRVERPVRRFRVHVCPGHDEALGIALNAPASHSVCGCAPMRTKSAEAGRVSRSPRSLSAIVSRSSWPSPWPSTASVRRRTSTFGRVRISRTR